MPANIGDKFGRLTVIEKWTDYRVSKTGSVYKTQLTRCQCDCGRITTPFAASLVTGNTRSCGCLSIESTRTRSTTHGLSAHRLFQIWKGIVDRCTNKNNHAYDRYGGRGINICERWKSFQSFADDMDSSFKDGLSIDRIDNNGDYTPSNCKWSTAKEQANNRRPRRIKLNP